jgi:hypothetical protein
MKNHFSIKNVNAKVMNDHRTSFKEVRLKKRTIKTQTPARK